KTWRQLLPSWRRWSPIRQNFIPGDFWVVRFRKRPIRGNSAAIIRNFRPTRRNGLSGRQHVVGPIGERITRRHWHGRGSDGWKRERQTTLASVSLLKARRDIFQFLGKAAN